MKKLLTVLTMAYGMLYGAGSCDLSQYGNVDVTWKSYKTPAKIGVGGHFTSVEYQAAAPVAKNFKKLLIGSKVIINSDSVDSNNAGRDATLVKFFFKMMAGANLQAEIVDIKAHKVKRGEPKPGVITIAVKMNGVTRKVPMNYRYFKGELSAKGVIDLFDFKAESALTSINTACYDLHSGKTWSDVEIGFDMKIKAVCLPEIK